MYKIFFGLMLVLPHNAFGMQKNAFTVMANPAFNCSEHLSQNVRQGPCCSVVDQTALLRKNNQDWLSLIAKAPKALRAGNVEERSDFFEAVIDKLLEKDSLPSDDFERRHCMSRLSAMAIFWAHASPEEAKDTLWQQLVRCKYEIDALKPDDITPANQELLRRVFKSLTMTAYNASKQCASTPLMCQRCTMYVKKTIAYVAVSSCCADSVNEGIVCDLCAVVLKTALSTELKDLVIGCLQFGPTIENPSERELIRWALLNK